MVGRIRNTMNTLALMIGQDIKPESTKQCWSCKRMDGYECGIKISDTNHITKLQIIKMPYCEVTGMAMYEVYDTPCSHYEGVQL